MKSKTLFTILLSVASCLFWMTSFSSSSIDTPLANLETTAQGRIGISAIDTGNGMQINYRAHERFPFCSTHKLMTVAAILKHSMTHPGFLQQKILYTQKDIVVYSPITEKHISDGMTIGDLCAAALMYTDNTAANLLVKQLGGIDAINHFARSISDNTFSMDRLEPDLNSAIPEDTRDTTTPYAMQNDLRQIVLGSVLAPTQRTQLQTWLENNTTGNKKIRAGIPHGWIVGDKTGSGDYGTSNDIAIIWPPGCHPIVLAIYFTQNTKNADHRDDIIATATRIIIGRFIHADTCLEKS